MLKRVILMLLAVLSATLAVYADQLKLKDGSVIEGTVITQGDNYWVKLANGENRTVKKSDVKEWVKGGGSGMSGAPSGGVVAPKPAGGGASFAGTKSKADREADRGGSPIVAVQIWEKWIEANPNSSDLEAAKKDLELWSQRNKDEAEKINGKWIGGEEKTELLKKVDQLVEEGSRRAEGTQFLEGIQKFEEAIKLYPQGFDANFWMGYFYLYKGIMGADGKGNVAYMNKAIAALEAARKAKPEIAATHSNLAIGYNFQKKHVESVRSAFKAVKIDDNKETVQNLVNSLSYAPAGMRKSNAEVRRVMEDALLLAGKYGINVTGGNHWYYIKPRPPEGIVPVDPDDPNAGKPGVAWTGSGFFVTEDGYLLTNHHVATGDPKGPIFSNINFRIKMDNGEERSAELIAVDDKADIALMKITQDSPVSFLKIADDNPKQGAKAMVLGYPFTGNRKKSLEVSEGQVKSVHEGEEHEVWYDLNTSRGNSGGPVVDKNCRVISILTAGRDVDLGFRIIHGVGPMQIKRFLEKIGEKAPTVMYAISTEGGFDGEKITEEARKATVLITAIRGAGDATAGDEKNETP